MTITSLEGFLTQQVQRNIQCSIASEIQIQVESQWSFSANPLATNTNVPTLDNLILVSTADTESPVFLYGLTISEYYLGSYSNLELSSNLGSSSTNSTDESVDTSVESQFSSVKLPVQTLLIHIDKVDSTALLKENLTFIKDKQPISLARFLIHKYVEYKILEKSANRIQLHLFSRSQPEYLFVESSKNLIKKPLTNMNLVHWWKKTLEMLQDLKDKSSGIEYTWFVPNEVEPTKRGSNSVNWNFKFPFDLNEEIVLIPRFNGDAKYALLESLKERDADEYSAMTVQEFMHVFSVIPECTGQNVSGLFRIDITLSSEDPSLVLSENLGIPKKEPLMMTANLQTRVPFEEWFDNTNFSCLESAIKSTAQIKSKLKNTQSTTCLLEKGTFEAKRKDLPVEVNDISFLVKKKRKSAQESQIKA